MLREDVVCILILLASPHYTYPWFTKQTKISRLHRTHWMQTSGTDIVEGHLIHSVNATELLEKHGKAI